MYFLDSPFCFFPSVFHFLSGYAAHLVGKWHLGFYKWPYVPTKRGFDTAYGFWDGAEGHFDHKRLGVVDFRDNLEPVKDLNGTYATYAYVNVSERWFILESNVERGPNQTVHALSAKFSLLDMKHPGVLLLSRIG